jgi:hypothetical protein
LLSFLEQILHGVLDIPYLIVNLLIESINGWILLIASLLAALLAVLPGFPSLPSLPGEVLSGVAWFLPITAMLAVLGTFVTAFVIFLGIQVGLRWFRAL